MSNVPTSAPSGEQLAAVASALPPLDPHGLGVVVEVLSICFATVATISLALRVYVRAGLARTTANLWGVDDVLAVLGFVSFTLVAMDSHAPEEEPRRIRRDIPD